MKNAASGQAFSDAPLQRAARHEAVAGSVHAAEAEEFFRSEVNALLPRTAFLELGQLSPDDVEKWADKWNVFAPCIVRAARAFVMCASEHTDIMREYADLGGGRQGMHAHPQWAQQLARLDGLPPVAPRYNGLADVISERERVDELRALQAERERLAKLRAFPVRIEGERYLQPVGIDRERYLQIDLPEYPSQTSGPR